MLRLLFYITESIKNVDFTAENLYTENSTSKEERIEAERRLCMKVNIYYGGRGLLDDPTLYVLNKMEEVLRELRVTIERINIYEHKNEIATLPQTMKDADGIILATTVEWLGIGGYMQQFLDACWLYGD